jgi:hypothetical protein
MFSPFLYRNLTDIQFGFFLRGFLFPLLYCKFLVITVSACTASYLSRELGFLVSVIFPKESLLTVLVSPHVMRS